MLKNIVGIIFIVILIVITAWLWEEGIDGLKSVYVTLWILVLTIAFLGFSIYSLFKKKYLQAFLSFLMWNFLILGPFHATWITLLYIKWFT